MVMETLERSASQVPGTLLTHVTLGTHDQAFLSATCLSFAPAFSDLQAYACMSIPAGAAVYHVAHS